MKMRKNGEFKKNTEESQKVLAIVLFAVILIIAIFRILKL